MKLWTIKAHQVPYRTYALSSIKTAMDPPKTKTVAELEVLDPATSHTFAKPEKRIHEGADVNQFLRSQAYRDIGLFVLQLNRALCPRKASSSGTDAESGAVSNAAAQTFSLDAPRNDPEVVKKLQALLTTVGAIIDEAPPDPGPRRFGNISFRRWHELLDSRADDLLRQYLPSEITRKVEAEGKDGDATALVELKAYFLGGFGSSQRLDYGTGHELSFVAFLGCLWKLGAFKGEDEDGEVERSISLGIIEP
jgi:serine/threonine-protein phosphatase 2A activator